LDRPDKTPISGIVQPAQPHAGPAFSSLASDVALRSEERRIYAPASPKAVSGQCQSARRSGRSSPPCRRRTLDRLAQSRGGSAPAISMMSWIHFLAYPQMGQQRCIALIVLNQDA
jgi:hypothetical protein